MTLKIIGAIMILLSCGGVGFQMATAQRKEIRILEQLCSLLDYMACELEYRMSPLPMLCRNVAKNAEGNLQKLFLYLAQELESQISPEASSCMNVALSRCKGLPQQAVVILQELGSTLGIFDIQGQLTGLEASLSACEQRLNVLRRNKDNRLRSYQTLGLCAGAALVILFI